MIRSDAPFVLLDDARKSDAAPARLYSDPVETITAYKSETLDTAIARVSAAQDQGVHIAGYLSYEAGLALEGRLQDRLPEVSLTPLLWFGLFKDYKEIAPENVPEHLPDPAGAWLGKLKPGITRAAYDEAFAKVQDYIIAGDIYQANLTFRAAMRFAGHPLALFSAVRDQAKAGYGGVVFDGQNWMLSFSPELFFALKNRRITAKPMKGTATREKNVAEDEKAKNTLQNDPKQRAENLMIVDLLRNDLSRAAEQGSVAVPQLFHIETYPTVHQMTSTVTATLADGKNAADLLRQIYPCGSITGAPKIRAMEIIDELEPDSRGIYCGSIGRIDANGDSAFNVAIRTFFIQPDKETLSIGLGSGIVADSQVGDEWRECLAKGRFAKVQQSTPVDLIETMAFDPAHGITRLEAHLERMKKSAAALEFSFDRHEARNTLHAVTFHQEVSAKVRLMLARSGAIAIEVQPMPAPHTEPVKCQLVPLQADRQDYRLHHKTSDRRVYDADGLDKGLHPLFLDADGFVTEGAIWNVFVAREGKLLTPRLTRGLLPGILRGELLEQGKAVEVDLTADDLAAGFFVGNSLRGLVKAVVK